MYLANYYDMKRYWLFVYDGTRTIGAMGGMRDFYHSYNTMNEALSIAKTWDVSYYSYHIYDSKTNIMLDYAGESTTIVGKKILFEKLIKCK